MATATSRLLDRAYRQRLAAVRDLLVAQIKRDYAQVTADDIATSFAAFADQAVSRITAGQATVESMAQAYVRGFLRAETGDPVELAPAPNVAGENIEGASLRSAVEPIGWMILGQIKDGHTPEEALATGEYLISRLTDNEITSTADKVVDRQSEAQPEITGWEGIVAPGSCDPCQENAGVHRVDDPIYRHPGCNCTKVPVHDLTPGQTVEERVAVAETTGPEVERSAADVRADGVNAEPRISSLLRDLTERVVSYGDAMAGKTPPTDGDLAGFENRIKALGSTARKIAMRVRDEHVTPTEAAQSIHDLVRYTVRTTPGRYVSKTEETVRTFLAKGYTNTKWKPQWSPDAAYVGINSNWRTPLGYEFEVQFHTAESFVSKELNHAAYEVQRVLDRTIPEQAQQFEELDRQMAERAANVTRPSGWERLGALVTDETQRLHPAP